MVEPVYYEDVIDDLPADPDRRWRPIPTIKLECWRRAAMGQAEDLAALETLLKSDKPRSQAVRQMRAMGDKMRRMARLIEAAEK